VEVAVFVEAKSELAQNLLLSSFKGLKLFITTKNTNFYLYLKAVAYVYPLQFDNCNLVE